VKLPVFAPHDLPIRSVRQKRLLDANFSFDPQATLIAVVLTALLAQASGWLASFRILRQKPLEVLRDE
jgi:ABC-type antimicrobial peptide transport system permease subunit